MKNIRMYSGTGCEEGVEEAKEGVVEETAIQNVVKNLFSS